MFAAEALQYLLRGPAFRAKSMEREDVEKSWRVLEGPQSGYKGGWQHFYPPPVPRCAAETVLRGQEKDLICIWGL